MSTSTTAPAGTKRGGNREARVLSAVVAMVDSLLDDFDVVELLTDLTERCAQLLDIESAGLLLADPRGQLHLIAATSHRTEELELFQLQADGRASTVSPAASLSQWPTWRQRRNAGRGSCKPVVSIADPTVVRRHLCAPFAGDAATLGASTERVVVVVIEIGVPHGWFPRIDVRLVDDERQT